MLLRIVVEAEAEDPQGVKEALAMALERYAPARVVEVAPVYRQERMAAMPQRERREAGARQGRADSTSSVTFGDTFSSRRRLQEVQPAAADWNDGGIRGCLPTAGSGRQIAAPTEKIGPRAEDGYPCGNGPETGPFARADAALRAAMEANEELRG